MRCPLLLFLVAIALTSAIPVGAEQTAQPGQVTPPAPRTPARAPDPSGTERIAGTSVLRGFVVAANNGAPVRRAQVSAFADPRRRGSSTTDAEGRFEIRELPAGKYTLQTSKSGFLMPGMEQAGRSLPGPRQIVELGDGQVVEKVVIRMSRGGVISGRVTDEFGEPVAGAQVNAMRYAYQAGRRQLGPARTASGGGFARTDDLGAFRLFGLPAGEYFVGAQPPREPSFFGPGDSAPPEGLATTYFPGSPDTSQARAVQVRAAQETQNISFALVRMRLSRVRGTALSSRGTPYVGAMVNVSPADSQFGMSISGGGGVGTDGSFTVSGLAPGAYTLTIRDMMMGGTDGEMGTTRIVVDGADVDGILITASKGGTARGRIVTDDGSPPPTVMVTHFPVDPMERGMMMGPNQSTVNDDGTFEIKGLFGKRVLRPALRGGPAGWTLKGVFVNGNDVTDEGLDFSSGLSVESIDVVFTQKGTRLSGVVTTDRRELAAAGGVLIFSADEKRWNQQSRYFRFLPLLGSTGKFEVRGLPVHDDYRVAAVPPLEDGQWADPDFLRGLLDVATRLSLNEGETKVQDLRMLRPER